MRNLIKTLGGLLLLACADLAAETYRDSPVEGWREVVFDGRTRYSGEGGCIRARSEDAASGLIRRVDVDLTRRPILAWAWRAERPLQGASAPERSKAGDDYLARVYVIHEGFFPWQTRAINYVWSRSQPVGSHWPNPFTDNAVMVAVQSGSEGLGEWQSFRRDVRKDFRRYHDVEIDRVDAVAIMTDTDNTGGVAEACYRLPQFEAAAP